MVYSEVIIVGGGPAGSTCAWELNRKQIQTLILDKALFPRHKLCAGWITPKTLKDLKIRNGEYPYSLITFNRIIFYFNGKRFTLKTNQHSIRRYEFDNWLIQRTNVPVKQHRVKLIKKKKDGYYHIDNKYYCKFIVGAGGTHCPVYRTFFIKSYPRPKQSLINTIEEELRYDYVDTNCYLWFFEDNLSGYSWYVPKGNGYLNVGIGGKALEIKKQGKTIADYWHGFTKKLERFSLVENYTFHPQGHNYYLRDPDIKGQHDNAFIIGDAAGLATIDMGEGIGPSIESAKLVAESIVTGKAYSPKTITKFSVFRMLFPWLGRLSFSWP
jgi:flavin-dependent dehydrogenase